MWFEDSFVYLFFIMMLDQMFEYNLKYCFDRSARFLELRPNNFSGTVVS